jgi:hypothetical protein
MSHSSSVSGSRVFSIMVSLDALEEREASEPHPLPITPGRAALRDFKPA